MRNDGEPPSCLRPPLFMIGQDSRGNWVARDQSGGRGGLFIDRAEALKFVHAENGYKPNAVVMVSGILELDMAAGPVLATRTELADGALRHRQVA